MVIPSVGMREGPRPNASRPVAARMLPETLPVKLAARYGKRLGRSSLNIMAGVDTQESRAMRTYPRSRMLSTRERMTRVGPGQGKGARSRAMFVISICLTYDEITINTAREGMVITESEIV